MKGRMMQPINDIDLLMLYRGQEIVLHPRHGIYQLDGVYSGGVIACRNPTGRPEDQETEIFEFDEISLLLKPTGHLRVQHLNLCVDFLRYKAAQGVWIGDSSTFNKLCQKPPLGDA